MFKWIKSIYTKIKSWFTPAAVKAIKDATLSAIAGVVVSAACFIIAGPYWLVLDLVASILLGALAILVVDWIEGYIHAFSN